MTEPSYKYKKEDDSSEEVLDDIRKHLKQVRQLNEANPHEQALKFEEIRKNPPSSDFMKVELIEKTIDDEPRIFSRSKQFDGSTKEIEEDPFFLFSPYIGYQSNIAKAPLNVMDVLLDETELIAVEERKAFKPEKRKDDKQWGWVLFVILAIVGSVGAGAYLVMRFL